MDEQTTTSQVIQSDQSVQKSNNIKSRTSNLIGISVFGLGIILLLRNLEIINPRIDIKELVSTWWPLVIIHFGIELIANNIPIIKPIWYIVLIATIAYSILLNVQF